MTSQLTYFDERSGDIYIVQLDAAGDFAHALRYVDRVGREKVAYDRMADLPSYVRIAIEHELTKSK